MQVKTTGPDGSYLLYNIFTGILLKKGTYFWMVRTASFIVLYEESGMIIGIKGQRESKRLCSISAVLIGADMVNKVFTSRRTSNSSLSVEHNTVLIPID